MINLCWKVDSTSVDKGIKVLKIKAIYFHQKTNEQNAGA
jgi:hypothetical protein